MLVKQLIEKHWQAEEEDEDEEENEGNRDGQFTLPDQEKVRGIADLVSLLTCPILLPLLIGIISSHVVF